MTDTEASPARVLLFAPTLRAGGAERLLAILAARFERGRVHPVVALLRDDPGAAFRRDLPADTAVHAFGKRSVVETPLIARWLASLLRHEQIDVAIGFMTYANLLLLTAARLSGRPVKVIPTEHSNPRHAGPARRRGLRMLAARCLYPRAARVVAVSDGVGADLARTLHLPASLVQTIHNPYDPRLDGWLPGQPPHRWFEGADPVVVAVGSLKPAKGYSILLDAMAALRARCPVRVIIVGDGPERAALERQAQQLDVEERIDFVGYQHDPFSFMRAADVFVLPSLWEGFPMALLEAARVGSAIVASDCDFGPREVVVDGESGLLVSPANAGALADAIARLVSDPPLRAQFRAAASQRSALFSPRVIVGRYEEMVAEVAALPDPTPSSR